MHGRIMLVNENRKNTMPWASCDGTHKINMLGETINFEMARFRRCLREVLNPKKVLADNLLL